MGTVTLVAAHKTNYVAACVSFGAAIFIIALNVKAEFEMRRRVEEAQRLMGIAIEAEMTAKIQAQKNLAKVLGALHAIRLGPVGHNGTDLYEFKVGEILFRVDQYYIYRERHLTCYSISAVMPVEEVMASAILLLGNDPTLFDRWRSHPGDYHA